MFSVDGGQTGLAQLNQPGGGSDYGDFAFTGGGAPESRMHLIVAFDSGPMQFYTASSAEHAMMETTAPIFLQPPNLTNIGFRVRAQGVCRDRRGVAPSLLQLLQDFGAALRVDAHHEAEQDL